MSAQKPSKRANRKQSKVNRSPNLEQLEARMMSTINGLENALQLLDSDVLLGGGFSAGPLNSAPTVQSAASLASGNDVRGRTASLSVLGGDNAGEGNLTYTWSAGTRPSGSTVSFDRNSSNSAKSTVATFSKAGNYTLTVTISDAAGLKTTSNLTVRVEQTLTSITVLTDANVPVSGTSALSVSGVSQKFKLQALDQFGQLMSTQPSFTWSTVSSPTDGTASVNASGSNATIAFNRSGSYRLKVESGSVSFAFNASVAQTATSFKLFRADGTQIKTGNVVPTNEASVRLTTTVYDQFGRALDTQPNSVWTQMSAPSGGDSTINVSRDSVSIAFTKSGAYGYKVQFGSLSLNFSISVSQKLTRLSVTTPEGTQLSSTVSHSVGTSSHKLSVRSLDQFGLAMNTQASSTWSLLSAPAGANATIAVASNVATVRYTTAGTYRFQVQVGSVSFTYTTVVGQTVVGLKVYGAGDTLLNNGKTISNSLATQVYRTETVDQFGTALAIQGQATWSVVSGPVGGSATFVANRDSTSISFTRHGTYTLKAQIQQATFTFTVNIAQVLSRLSILGTDGRPVSLTAANTISGATQQVSVSGVDQFGRAMTTQPSFQWTSTSAPANATPTITASQGSAVFRFTQTGNYRFQVAAGSLSTSFDTTVIQAASSFSVTRTDGSEITTGSALTTAGTSLNVIARVLDQFGTALTSQPTLNWLTTLVPSEGATSISTSNGTTNISFTKAGTYGVRATTGSLTFNVTLNVAQTFSSITLAPGTGVVQVGGTLQFTAVARDQFQNSMGTQPSFTWSASAGSISSTGLFTAPNSAMTVTISASSDSISGSVTASVATSADLTKVLSNSTLAGLVQNYLVDNSITRTEMIQLLRAAGSDGSVDSVELADLRYVVGNASVFKISEYVQVLASNVVNGNVANARYKGAAAGNLAANSSATLLNNLVDKWFLGTDLPALTASGISYQNASGQLFGTNPSHLDERQGQLGDCYFISALGAIADRNPTAVRNMFIDNGDGTFTVRFYTGTYRSVFNSDGSINAGFSTGVGVADYVTVNRQLPGYSNATFAYSNYGQSMSSSANILWIALAEKAYAQWNETGKSGRNNTNTYAGIEGGLMDKVSAQVLGYNATDYLMSSAQKSSLINALNSGKAVTIGTNGNASAGGLVGSHAYVVTGYNSSTDRFTLFNPWAMMHPTPLSWDDLRANCSLFTVADASRSSGFSSGAPSLAFRSESPEMSYFANNVESSVAESLSPESEILNEIEILREETRIVLEAPSEEASSVRFDEMQLANSLPGAEAKEGDSPLDPSMVDSIFGEEGIDALFADCLV